LDFAVDGRVNFDYAAATKSGLEYGAHFELDLYQSDDDAQQTLATTALAKLWPTDIATGDVVEFNDGYVYVNTALGNLSFGDTGLAGEATNQLHVPILTTGALEIDQIGFNVESEQVFYANSFAGVDFEASVDDDAAWSLGLSAGRHYFAGLGQNREANKLAGSLQLTAGGLSAGVNYASSSTDKYQTLEYIAAGAGYEMGALSIGAGVETAIQHLSYSGSGEYYTTNVFAGMSYEIAVGLTLALGVGNLDADSWANRSNLNIANPQDRKRTFNAIGSVQVDF
jgi:opacity protein-like surface antigen